MKRVVCSSTDLICLECGYVTTIWRKSNDQKKVGHIKDMFCPCCQKDVKFYELKDLARFKWRCLEERDLTAMEWKILCLLKEREEGNERSEFGVHRKILTKR